MMRSGALRRAAAEGIELAPEPFRFRLGGGAGGDLVLGLGFGGGAGGDLALGLGFGGGAGGGLAPNASRTSSDVSK